ncbi:MAG: L-threonylcarbamoyladenylate synthase [Armatimonadetes bacterium]|nr:L-threonylcarbamoyladenylate synthase [Armatimonadota bacterium]MDW8027056.1 L-threonylcarbamoyladenylate synthase [Armatimonadota bacterium]
MTKVWKVNPEFPDPKAIQEAAELIRSGGLVAFPTETVYGLGANALDEKAVRKIFIAKERPAWDPLIVHICDLKMIELLVDELPEQFHELAKRFMPGPLTVVLRKKPSVPDLVTAGLPTVAVRMPNHTVALALIRESGLPIAAPSANKFGRPSPTTAEHVLQDLTGCIDGVLDAGPTHVGVESTVLDLTKKPPLILRPGGFSKEAIEQVLGEVFVISKVQQRLELGLPSPGMMPRHYAPSVPVILTEGDPEKFVAEIETLRNQLPDAKRMGALLPEGWMKEREGVIAFKWGKWGNWEELAQKLFEGLRWLERQDVAFIVAPLPPPIGLGLAIRDRLTKAAYNESQKLTLEQAAK